MLAGTHGAAAPGPQSLWGARLRVPQLRADLAAGVGDDLPPACAAQLWDVLDAPGDGLLVHPGQRTLRAWQLFEEDGLRTQARPASCAGAGGASPAPATQAQGTFRSLPLLVTAKPCCSRRCTAPADTFGRHSDRCVCRHAGNVPLSSYAYIKRQHMRGLQGPCMLSSGSARLWACVRTRGEAQRTE